MTFSWPEPDSNSRSQSCGHALEIQMRTEMPQWCPTPRGTPLPFSPARTASISAVLGTSKICIGCLSFTTSLNPETEAWALHPADLSHGSARRPLRPQRPDSPVSSPVFGTGQPLRSPGGAEPANRIFPGSQPRLCFPPTSLQQKQGLGQGPNSRVCGEGVLGHSPGPSPDAETRSPKLPDANGMHLGL